VNSRRLAFARTYFRCDGGSLLSSDLGFAADAAVADLVDEERNREIVNHANPRILTRSRRWRSESFHASMEARARQRAAFRKEQTE